MKLKIKQGTLSKLVKFFVQDSSATDGSGLTGLVYNSSGLTAYYIAEGDAVPTQVTLASGTTGTWSSGGWSEVDAAIMPGIYEIGLPDAAVDATSEGSVLVMLRDATNMAPVLIELELDAVDYRDATDFGLGNLDRAISETASTKHYTFNDNSAPDYVDVYTLSDVAENFPKVQKAILRMTLSGTVSSSSDWRCKLYPPALPSSGYDLIDGITLPTSISNYILQIEVDVTTCSTVDGSWMIVLEDFNTSGNSLSIDDAAIEFSDVPSEVGDATSANQTAVSNAIAALNNFDPSVDPVANVVLVNTCTTNSDMRGTDGANTVAPDNAGIAANGTTISSLNNITVQQVWDALTSGSYASGSFGERLLTSQGTQRTVQVTGSNHVAADVHEFQNDAITAAAIAADAVTELQTGLVTVGTAFTYTNGAGDTHNVTIS